jgi:inosine-uridine nucleoside N-ribohydrolase
MPMSFYHIDTDMGVDDGLSLLVADRFLHGVLALSTVFGNVPVEIATRNAVIIRELLKPTDGWDIVTGAECAVDGFRRDARHMHGTDGLGGAVAGLDPALLQRVSSQVSSPLTACEPPTAGPVTLIGLGPATNIPNLVSWYGQSVIERSHPDDRRLFRRRQHHRVRRVQRLL